MLLVASLGQRSIVTLLLVTGPEFYGLMSVQLREALVSVQNRPSTHPVNKY